MTDTTISTMEAARMLGCSQRTVQRMIDRGILTAWKVTPGLKSVWVVREKDVQAILAERERVAGKKGQRGHHKQG